MQSETVRQNAVDISDVGSVKYEMGYASALSVVLFILMFGTRRIIVQLLNKVGQ